MKRYWWVLILPLLLLVWWGLDRRDATVTIHFSTVRQALIESTVSTNGRIEPVEWAAARAETSGVVRKVAVERGQQVIAGQTLVALDTSAAQSAVAAALATEQQARAESAALAQGGKASTLADLNNSIASAQSAVKIAQRAYESMQRLGAQQAATKLQVQSAKDELEKAKLHLVALEDQKKTLVTSSDRSVAEAKLQDAAAALALARHRLTLSNVQTPISGTLYQFDLKMGAYLQPGEQGALVGNLDRVKVTVYVDEPDLGRVSKDIPVGITWDARPGKRWWGRVTKLPSEVIALGTRTVGEISTVVDNPDHDLLPGVSVNVLIISKVVKDAVSIPKAALRTIRGVNGVYRLNGDVLAWKPITTGVSDVNNVQVVSGLANGDKVADRV
ncbi:MAG TPA: efflux RND transporter periplasmic adaptor subunit, partial [Bryobacteraceae bacterium]|nr:efflux RND transporter periplasmic adaptor subunit [Bryobacteraceae bacterium]